MKIYHKKQSKKSVDADKSEGITYKYKLDFLESRLTLEEKFTGKAILNKSHTLQPHLMQ